jgi:cytochrome P450
VTRGDAPSEPVDFDHLGPDYVRNFHAVNRHFAEKCPVAWSSLHGGFWALTGYDAVKTASTDDDVYSSWHDLPDGETAFRGVDVPGQNMRMSFLELDPPDHMKWRRQFNPWFTPAAVQARWSERGRELAEWCVDRVIDKGSMEVIEDLAGPVPAMVTLDMLGLPLEQWKPLSFAAHNSIATPAGSREHAEAEQAFVALFQSIPAIVSERRADPRDDLLTALAQMKIDGEALTEQEIVDTTVLIISGGVDTTTNLTAQSLHYLATHDEDRQRLIADRSLLRPACEEFLRYFSPVTMNGRTITRDTELGGVPLSANQRVLLSWAGANADPNHWDSPEKVIIDRKPNRHLAFGLGVHRCIGSHLAREMFVAMLNAFLDRIPSYEIDGAVEPYQSLGNVNGVGKLPIRFPAAAARGLTIAGLGASATKA